MESFTNPKIKHELPPEIGKLDDWCVVAKLEELLLFNGCLLQAG